MFTKLLRKLKGEVECKKCGKVVKKKFYVEEKEICSDCEAQHLFDEHIQTMHKAVYGNRI